jgi:NAD(P)-dependent dehydrogenase (short-subunit alcohol dehydrogenase family)
MGLKGKIALVTGGALVIGAAIADRYIAEGARVAVADISFAGDRETAARHGAAVFLASSDSDCVVVRTPNVDGGNWMG